MGIEGANILGLSFEPKDAIRARDVVVADWQRYHYSMTMRIGENEWLHFDGNYADPKTYSTPYSTAFLAERRDMFKHR